MSAPRRLVIVGLGNYTHPLTRHSVGQHLLSSLAQRASLVPSSTGSPNLLLNAQKTAWTTTITLPSLSTTAQGISVPPISILFVRPRALMNISGPPSIALFNAFVPSSSRSPSHSLPLLTLQDDLDLPSLSLKFQKGGSARGHNGVRSIEKVLGGRKDFGRVRIGVGRPEGEKGAGVVGWVMGPLGRAEVDYWGEEGAGVEKVWEVVQSWVGGLE